MANGKEIASVIVYDAQTSTLYRTMVCLLRQCVRMKYHPNRVLVTYSNHCRDAERIGWVSRRSLTAVSTLRSRIFQKQICNGQRMSRLVDRRMQEFVY